LVLELIGTLHPKSEERLLKTILNHWQSFLAFSIGFVTILICWSNHHVAFEYIKKVDTELFWINGFLLFVVTLTPFSTALLVEYIETEGGIAMAIFGFKFFLISIAADRICSYAFNHHFIDERDRKFYYSYKRIYRYSIFYTLISFLLCFVSVGFSLILYALLFVMFATPKELTLRVEKLRMRR
jgi:uncharacterized membrane protein